MSPVTLLFWLLLAQPEPAARRLAVLDPAATSAALAAALSDPDPLVARTAGRRLIDLGPGSAAHLPAILQHADALLRANAALGLGAWGAAGVEPLALCMADRDETVRRHAVLALATIRPVTEAIVALESKAAEDESQMVRDAAAMAMAQAYRTVESIRLPGDDWRFHKDPDDAGRDGRWFAVEFDDSGWSTIGIEAAWQQFGHDYLGVAWYRRTFELPGRADPAQRAMLSFGGVDEDAWVWLNGRPAGEHAIGPTGWDKPFRLDVTRLVRWGAPNQLTVRVYNSAMAGGIWQPVTLKLSVLAK